MVDEKWSRRPKYLSGWPCPHCDGQTIYTGSLTAGELCLAPLDRLRCKKCQESFWVLWIEGDAILYTSADENWVWLAGEKVTW